MVEKTTVTKVQSTEKPNGVVYVRAHIKDEDGHFDEEIHRLKGVDAIDVTEGLDEDDVIYCTSENNSIMRGQHDTTDEIPDYVREEVEENLGKNIVDKYEADWENWEGTPEFSDFRVSA